MEAVRDLAIRLEPAIPKEGLLEEVVLDPELPKVFQVRKTWCWAACMVSALRRAGSNRYLRDFVSIELECGQACQGSVVDERCERRMSADEVHCLWLKYGFPQAQVESGSMSSLEGLRAALSQGPIQALLGKKHVVLIDGFRMGSFGTLSLRVMDPGSDSGKRWLGPDLDDVHSGAWSHSILGLGYDGEVGSC